MIERFATLRCKVPVISRDDIEILQALGRSVRPTSAIRIASILSSSLTLSFFSLEALLFFVLLEEL